MYDSFKIGAINNFLVLPIFTDKYLIVSLEILEFLGPIDWAGDFKSVRQQGGLWETYFILFYIKFERQVIYEMLIRDSTFITNHFHQNQWKYILLKICFYIPYKLVD